MTRQEKVEAKLLETQFKKSIRYKKIEDALHAFIALGLEIRSALTPGPDCTPLIAAMMREDDQRWADAILAAENALKPVDVTAKKPTLPVLVCDACGKPTPGTIEGLCLRCDSLKSLLEDILPCDEDCQECNQMFVMPRRIN